MKNHSYRIQSGAIYSCVTHLVKELVHPAGCTLQKKTTIIRIGRLKRSVAADSYAPKFQASPDDRLVGNVFAR